MREEKGKEKSKEEQEEGTYEIGSSINWAIISSPPIVSD